MLAVRLTLIAMLLTLLSGCGQRTGPAVLDGAPHGRYAGIGIFSPGKLWAQIVPADREAKQDPALAKLADDEAIIVVVDSRTGEVRECGNLSGYCASVQPWTRAVSGGPIRLLKHSDEVGDTNTPANTVADAPTDNASH